MAYGGALSPTNPPLAGRLVITGRWLSLRMNRLDIVSNGCEVFLCFDVLILFFLQSTAVVGGSSASAGVRAQLREALEDGDRARGGGGRPDHAREGGGVRAAQRGHVARAGPPRDIRERAEGPQQGKQQREKILIGGCCCSGQRRKFFLYMLLLLLLL